LLIGTASARFITMTPDDLKARTKKFAVHVCRAKSRADFINKLGGAIEEVDESALWLEILSEAEICSTSLTTPLWKEADELTRILVRSRETARANQQSPNRK
jgi:hypothetical protein